MLKITESKRITSLKLAREIVPLNLPNFTGVVVLSRETDDNGVVVLVNGRPVSVPQYILIKSDALRAAQVTAVQNTIDAHVPERILTDAEKADADKDSKLNREIINALIGAVAEIHGIPKADVISKVRSRL